MNEINTCVVHVLHSVSHLLCAMLVLDSTMSSTLNSMFVIPVSAREECAIVAHRGVGVMKFITINFHVHKYHGCLMNIYE